MDKNIEILIRNEVKRQLSISGSSQTQEPTKEDIANALTAIIEDMEENIHVLTSDMDKNLSILKAFCATITKGKENTEVAPQPQQVRVTPRPANDMAKPRKVEAPIAPPVLQDVVEDDVQDDALVDEEPEWVKTQDGNLEKGDMQIWQYGNHILNVWNDGKKYYAQVDGEQQEELWRQKDLEKIQRRVEKLP